MKVIPHIIFAYWIFIALPLLLWGCNTDGAGTQRILCTGTYVNSPKPVDCQWTYGAFPKAPPDKDWERQWREEKDKAFSIPDPTRQPL